MFPAGSGIRSSVAVVAVSSLDRGNRTPPPSAASPGRFLTWSMMALLALLAPSVLVAHDVETKRLPGLVPNADLADIVTTDSFGAVFRLGAFTGEWAMLSSGQPLVQPLGVAVD